MSGKRDRDEKLATLGEVPFLRAGSRRTLERIARLAELADAPAGTVLTNEGDTAYEAYVIVRGEVDVIVGGAVVAVLGRGQFVGETAVLDHGPRTATVVARTPLRYLVLDRRRFASFIEEPAVGQSLSRTLAERLRAADARVAVPH